jgi:hypothetical protein
MLAKGTGEVLDGHHMTKVLARKYITSIFPSGLIEYNLRDNLNLSQ